MEMLLGDYIVCVVTAEMPSRFEVEALKAQAIACRSFTLYRSSRSAYYNSSSHGESGADVCTNSGHCQAYLTYDAALERWHSKSYTDERIEKIKRAVVETSGIVAAYDGAPIEALYHATSYGYTENYYNNWGGKRPYLVAVTTPETLETNHIVSTDTFSSAEVVKILKKYGDPVLPEDKNEWFKLVPNDSGRVGKSDICGIQMNGQALRGAFGLASSKFTVSYNAEKDEFTFDVRGWGHGVGLSQYGAGILADQGYTCEQIIKHYYTGIELILWR
jgi:stage II sporulation protein D